MNGRGDERRPCLIGKSFDQKAMFHRWVEASQIVPPSNLVGGHGGGVIKETFALVETEGGGMKRVYPENVRFVDSTYNLQSGEHDILREAVDTFGPEHQQIIAIEEMAELIKELCKQYRGFENQEHVTEEIADVDIMLEQLILIFGCQANVDSEKVRKIERLKRRIESATGH